MNLDKRVQSLEQRTDRAEPVEAIEIHGVLPAPGHPIGRVLTCTIGRDRDFTLKEPAQ